MNDITILVVNWNANDFLSLLLESIDIFASEDPDVVVVDNSVSHHPLPKKFVTYFPQSINIGHGEGLNYGMRHIKRKHVLVLDVDCHLLRKGWEDAFRKTLDNFTLVAGKGVPQKPIRPAIMFMRTIDGVILNWRASEGYQGHRITPDGLDVGIEAYHWLRWNQRPICLLENQKNRYGTLNGEEWLLDGLPFVYHHWHGSHLKERSVDFPGADLEADKALLFKSVGWRLAENLL